MTASVHFHAAIALAFSLAASQKPAAPRKAPAAVLLMEANKAAYRDLMVECYEKGNMAAADKYVAESFIDHDLRDPARGREGFKETVASYRAAFPDLDVEIERIVAEGDRTVARVRIRGTHSGSYLGRAATHRKVDVVGYDEIRWENGLAVEHWGVFDNLAMLQQMGILPPVDAIVRPWRPIPPIAEGPE